MSKNIWNNEYNPFNKYKTLCWYNRMKKIKTGNFAPPVNIALDIIQGTATKKKCGQFNCNFCMSNWKEFEKPAEIPNDILFAIPKFYSEWGVKSICLAGHHSDPCIINHDKLIKFLRLCNKYNIEIGFVSNGAYYSDILLEEVARTCNWSGWSINAGTKIDHSVITGTHTFDKIIENIVKMSDYIKTRKIDHDIGYKYLITDDNWEYIYKGIETASKIGVRHFQLRPTDLSKERTEKINIDNVERQIKEGIRDFERSGEFEIFGIREKFSSDFKKITPYKCIASPLGSTWKANGNIVICPDSRHTDVEEERILCNFINDGLEAVRREWGGLRHKKMIELANENINNCHRCTGLQWHNLYREVIELDSMDVTLI